LAPTAAAAAGVIFHQPQIDRFGAESQLVEAGFGYSVPQAQSRFRIMRIGLIAHE
jgi:hypothetical protein